jgi:hypothetical protein
MEASFFFPDSQEFPFQGSGGERVETEDRFPGEDGQCSEELVFPGRMGGNWSIGGKFVPADQVIDPFGRESDLAGYIRNGEPLFYEKPVYLGKIRRDFTHEGKCRRDGVRRQLRFRTP